MVELYATLSSDEKDNLINASTNIVGNNISSAIGDVLNKAVKPTEYFLLGKTKLSEGKYYAPDQSKYFISEDFSDKDGYFNEAAEIEFYTNRNVNNIMLFVMFDVKNQAYPNTVSINGKTYNLKSPIATLFFNSKIGVANTIKFNTWNKPNMPIVIQGISTVLTINSSDLFNLSFTGDERSNFNIPSWGIKSNSGSLKLRDTYGLLKSLADIIEQNDVEIGFYLKSSSKTGQIGSFIIKNIFYDRQTNVGNIEYNDVLSKWDRINTAYIPLQLKSSVDTIAGKINAPNTIKIYDDATKNHLLNILINEPYVELGSSWANWVKICEVSGCYIYCNEKGEPTIRYGGGT